ncbi:uncharacterized protein [Macrobrachium rosenbergii]|uniref:uncharacterized protein n=1 Tax=Macrobrachium rosenbergii TaxID=79674 RepID=UPI0034D5FB22
MKRTSDRAMVVKLCLDGKVVNIVSAYAPQAGWDEVEKVTFWEEVDRQLSEIPAEERLIIGGDMNGHVGRTREGIERVHGGWGVGERNDEEERSHLRGVRNCKILNGECVATQHMVVVMDLEIRNTVKGRLHVSHQQLSGGS